MNTPGSTSHPLRVAVVGSGPSGLYAAAALAEAEGLTVEVDVFDGFKIDTDIGPDGDTSVGVQWKKDF